MRDVFLKRSRFCLRVMVASWGAAGGWSVWLSAWSCRSGASVCSVLRRGVWVPQTGPRCSPRCGEEAAARTPASRCQTAREWSASQGWRCSRRTGRWGPDRPCRAPVASPDQWVYLQTSPYSWDAPQVWWAGCCRSESLFGWWRSGRWRSLCHDAVLCAAVGR